MSTCSNKCFCMSHCESFFTPQMVQYLVWSLINPYYNLRYHFRFQLLAIDWYCLLTCPPKQSLLCASNNSTDLNIASHLVHSGNGPKLFIFAWLVWVSLSVIYYFGFGYFRFSIFRVSLLNWALPLYRLQERTSFNWRNLLPLPPSLW